MRRLWRHPWSVGVRNVLLMLVLYSLLRLFYFWVNCDLYPDVNTAHLIEMMVGGLRFDVTALFYLNSVYMVLMWLPLPLSIRNHPLYQRVARCLFWGPNAVGIIANLVDTIYVRFSGRRTTIAVFAEFEHENNLLQVLGAAAAEYWYVTLVGVLAIGAMVWLTSKTDDDRRPFAWYNYCGETLLLIVSVYFMVIGIRSGFGAYTRPLAMSNAAQYIQRPAECNIVLNTPFCIMRSTEGEAYSDPHYMSEEEMVTIYSPLHPADSMAVANRKNVVIVILESFSKEFSGYLNPDFDNGTYEGFTPFLDSLMQAGVTYPITLATGRKSIDAMPAILSGIPRLGSPFILTPYCTNAVEGIPSCLRRMGYRSAFYHGAPNGSMGFQAYARQCGFEAYMGMSEYGNDADFDGCWAIWDRPFLQYVATSLSETQQPFVGAVFTASSHHPFRVPADWEDSRPDEVPLHDCVRYSDDALRRFFATASTKGWYDNTLFVITADHTNSLSRPEYMTDRGLFEVPIVFFDPSWEREGKPHVCEAHPVAQSDIMASVLRYVGYPDSYISFGSDVLSGEKETPYTVIWNEPLYQTFSDSLLLQTDGHTPLHVYRYKEDRLLENDMAERYEESEEVERMLRYTQAFTQQYMTRMINNQLVAE